MLVVASHGADLCRGEVAARAALSLQPRRERRAVAVNRPRVDLEHGLVLLVGEVADPAEETVRAVHKRRVPINRNVESRGVRRVPVEPHPRADPVDCDGGPRGAGRALGDPGAEGGECDVLGGDVDAAVRQLPAVGRDRRCTGRGIRGVRVPERVARAVPDGLVLQDGVDRREGQVEGLERPVCCADTRHDSEDDEGAHGG